MVQGILAAPRPGEQVEAGHAHRDAHLHLLQDYRAIGIVGHIGVDLDAPVHRAGCMTMAWGAARASRPRVRPYSAW